MKKLLYICVFLFLLSSALSAIMPPNLIVFFDPAQQEVDPNSKFLVNLDCLPQNWNIAAFEMTITFDPDVLEMDYDFYKDLLISYNLEPMPIIPTNIADEMGRHFILKKPGVLEVTCFNVNGFGTNLKTELIPLHMKSKGYSGKTEIAITIDFLTDTSTRDLLRYIEGTEPAQIRVIDNNCPYKLGDVNGDGKVNILDALLICNYPYGTWRTNFEACAADVDRSGSINIIDALLIAQYYVGFIDDFPS